MNALEQLRSFELLQHLAAMIEKRLSGGFWITELPSRQTVWSDGMYELFEHDRAGFSPTFASINDATHPDDRRTPSELETAITAGFGYDREQRIITRRGRLRSISARIEFEFEPSGAPRRLVGIIFDVTQLREQQQIADAMRARFGVLVKAATLLAWSARPDGVVDSITGLDNLGYREATQSAGWSWPELVHPEDRDKVVTAWARSIESGEPYALETRIRRQDESYLWVAARALPVRKPSGRIVEWIGSLSDIQARKVWQIDPDDAAPSGPQLRAARGLLNWSVDRLSADSGVSRSLIRRFEDFDGVSRGEVAALAALKACLKQAGVDFVFPPNGKGGVRPA